MEIILLCKLLRGFYSRKIKKWGRGRGGRG
jgi:hypothetical protein